jgi:hypothetical protein
VGVDSKWVHSALRPPIGQLWQPRVIMIMEKLVEWLAGETEGLGENLPSAALSTTNPTWCLDANPGSRGRKPATNRLSYVTASTGQYSFIIWKWQASITISSSYFTHFALCCILVTELSTKHCQRTGSCMLLSIQFFPCTSLYVSKISNIISESYLYFMSCTNFV